MGLSSASLACRDENVRNEYDYHTLGVRKRTTQYLGDVVGADALGVGPEALSDDNEAIRKKKYRDSREREREREREN